MNAQGFDQTGRQHRHAVFTALALAHQDLAALEIEIFDPQAQPFQQAEAAAVEQLRDEALDAGHLPQHALHLRFGQHGGQALGLPGADGFQVEGVQLLPQHFAIEEQEGAEGLRLRRGRDLFRDGQVDQKGADFGRAHVAGMALVVEEDKTAHPSQVSLFGTQRIVLES